MSDLQIRIMRAGASGKDAWTPVIAIAEDGFRLVMKIINWVGGEGEKPVCGLYIGQDGYVDEIEKAVDVRGVGQKGWSPVLSVSSEGERRVLKVYDWTGGEGEKPEIGGYIGLNGLVEDITAAIDIRGQQGPQGIQGLKGDKGDTGPVGPTANPGSINNDMLATMPANTLKGAVAAGAAQDLTAAQAWGVIGSAGKATQAAVITGTDNTTYVTPSTLAGAKAWTTASKITLTAPSAIIDIPIPAIDSLLRLTMNAGIVADVTNTQNHIVFRFSTDGGLTFLSSANSYYVSSFHATKSTSGVSAFDYAQGYLTARSESSLVKSVVQADIALSHGAYVSYRSSSFNFAPTADQMQAFFGGFCRTTTRPTHIRLFRVDGSSFTTGTSVVLEIA